MMIGPALRRFEAISSPASTCARARSSSRFARASRPLSRERLRATSCDRLRPRARGRRRSSIANSPVSAKAWLPGARPNKRGRAPRAAPGTAATTCRRRAPGRTATAPAVAGRPPAARGSARRPMRLLELAPVVAHAAGELGAADRRAGASRPGRRTAARRARAARRGRPCRPRRGSVATARYSPLEPVVAGRRA